MENERKKKFVQVMKCTAKMLEIIIFFFFIKQNKLVLSLTFSLQRTDNQRHIGLKIRD